MTEDATKDFFLSYNRADRTWAEWIAWQLEAHGYRTIVQAWDFRPGSNFALQMQHASSAATRTLAVLSPDYLTSLYTQPEWAAAFVQDPTGLQNTLLPVQVRPCELTGLLPAIVHIDLVGLNEPEATATLLAGVQRTRAKPATAPTFPGTISPQADNVPSFPGTLPTIWNIPFRRNPFFTGREPVFERLHQLLHAGKTTALIQPQAISGLGGIGKTQVAIEYAYRYREDYKTILWVNAGTREELIADIVTISERLNLPEKNAQNQNTIITAVKHWLETHTGWLLILDNADDLTIARPYLQLGDKGYILLTTRTQIMSGLAHKIEIEKMELEEGTLFLFRRANLIAQDATFENAVVTKHAQAVELVQEMGCLPLALDQAGAYIEETRCSMSDYLVLYRKQRSKLLNRRGGLDPDHPAPVATTWSLSFEKIEKANPAAADLLRLCAFLAPESIPEEIFTEGASVLGPPLHSVLVDPYEYNAAVEELLKYSLVYREANTHTVSIHRLVQTILQDNMNSKTRLVWAELAVKATEMAFPKVNFETWPLCERCLPHAQICATLIQANSMAFAEAIRLLNKIADYLQERGQYLEAETYYLQALKIYEQHQITTSHDTITTIHNLGHLYVIQNRYTEAKLLFERALEVSEQNLGSDHHETIECLDELAFFYLNYGMHIESEQLYQRALAISIQILGPNHPVTARRYHSLAFFYHAMRKFAEAEPLYKQALAICEQQSESNELFIASILHSLALCYQIQKRYTEAESFFQRILAIYERQLGPEHPETASELHYFAWYYHVQKKYSKAEPLYQRAIAIYQEQLGAEHPTTINELEALASCYDEQGKFGETESLYQQNIVDCERELGPIHTRNAQSLHLLANFYQNQGRFIEAEPLYQHALTICEQQLIPIYHDTIQSLQLLADCYQRQEKYAEAELLYQRVLAIMEQQLGLNHLIIAENLILLADCYQSQEKYSEAEPLYQRALTIVELQLRFDPNNLVYYLYKLAVSYHSQEKYTDAEPLYQRALAVCKDHLESKHHYTYTILKNYAALLRKMKRTNEAARLERRAKAIRTQQISEKEHKTTDE